MRITWKGIRRALGLKPRPGSPPPLLLGELAGKVEARPVAIHQWIGSPEDEQLRARDNWFHSHCVYAPHVICEALAPHLDLSASRVLDLGCGDGIMALGVRRRGVPSVACTDLTRAFDTLAARAREVIGLAELPQGLEFRQGEAGRPLPFADGEFDAVYSWSVFEHVDGVDGLLAEVVRVLRPGGIFYLQIEPLYYSAYGSHLRRLVEQPWAHLLHDAAAYAALIEGAGDHTRVEEKDLLYVQNEFDNVKRYLIGEYHTLNRIRSVELVDAVRRAGLEILSCELGQRRSPPAPEALTAQYGEHDLLTNEIRLVLRRR